MTKGTDRYIQTQKLERRDDIVFGLLRRAAEKGDRCPSNLDICFAVGFGSASAGPRILARIEKAGLIKVYSGQCSRVVEIVGTGKRTAGDIPRPHWRDRPENKHRKHKQYRVPIKPHPAPPEPCASFSVLRVERDPCPYCGVRGDVSCKHRVAG